MSAASALDKGRRLAESLMVDSCRITTTTPGDWDDATGTYLPGITTTVYEGKCRIRNAAPAPQGVTSGEAAYAVDIFTLSLPIVGSEAVGDGMAVTVTASAHDPGTVGAVFTISGPHVQTFSTARRFSVKAVSRDA